MCAFVSRDLANIRDIGVVHVTFEMYILPQAAEGTKEQFTLYITISIFPIVSDPGNEQTTCAKL